MHGGKTEKQSIPVYELPSQGNEFSRHFQEEFVHSLFPAIMNA